MKNLEESLERRYGVLKIAEEDCMENAKENLAEFETNKKGRLFI